VNQLPRKCGRLSVSKPFGSQWTFAGIAIPFYCIFLRHSSVLFLYVFLSKYTQMLLVSFVRWLLKSDLLYFIDVNGVFQIQ
jgi:hypothetical protein